MLVAVCLAGSGLADSGGPSPPPARRRTVRSPGPPPGSLAGDGQDLRRRADDRGPPLLPRPVDRVLGASRCGRRTCRCSSGRWRCVHVARRRAAACCASAATPPTTAFWDPGATPLPRVGVHAGAARGCAQARQLVRRLGIKLILDLNLITDSPATAAQWARAAEARLPARQHHRLRDRQRARHLQPRRLAGDHRRPPVLGPGAPSAVAAGRRSPPHRYVADFRDYARALAQVAPHTSWPGRRSPTRSIHRRWVDGADRRCRPFARTGHHPPLPVFGCAGAAGPVLRRPIAALLGPAAAGGWRARCGRDRCRPRRRPAAAADRAELGQLRRPARGQQLVRHRAVGARRAVLAAAGRRRRRSTSTCAPMRSTRRSPRSGRAGRPPAALRPGHVRPRARTRRPAGRAHQHAAPPDQPGRVGGPGRRRHAPRAADRQEPAVGPGRRCACRATADGRRPAAAGAVGQRPRRASRLGGRSLGRRRPLAGHGDRPDGGAAARTATPSTSAGRARR